LKSPGSAWRGEEEDATAGKKVAAGTVAAVTFANGGDNIGVYVPVLLNLDATGVAVFCVLLLALVRVLVWPAKFIPPPGHRRDPRALRADPVPAGANHSGRRDLGPGPRFRHLTPLSMIGSKPSWKPHSSTAFSLARKFFRAKKVNGL